MRGGPSCIYGISHLCENIYIKNLLEENIPACWWWLSLGCEIMGKFEFLLYITQLDCSSFSLNLLPNDFFCFQNYIHSQRQRFAFNNIFKMYSRPWRKLQKKIFSTVLSTGNSWHNWMRRLIWRNSIRFVI